MFIANKLQTHLEQYEGEFIQTTGKPSVRDRLYNLKLYGKSVQEQTIASSNILDKAVSMTTTSGAYQHTWDSATQTYSLKTVDSGASNMFVPVNIKTIEGKRYVFSYWYKSGTYAEYTGSGLHPQIRVGDINFKNFTLTPANYNTNMHVSFVSTGEVITAFGVQGGRNVVDINFNLSLVQLDAGNPSAWVKFIPDSPSPLYPSEIKSVPYDVEIVSCGSNIFNKRNNAIQNGTVTTIDDYVRCTGNITAGSNNTHSRGWYCPNLALLSQNFKQPLLKQGDIITISADIRLIENRNGANMLIHVYSKSQNSGQTSTEIKELILNSWVRISQTYTITSSDLIGRSNYYPIFTLNSNVVDIKNVAIKYGTDNIYTPYNGSVTSLSLIGAPDTEWAGQEIDLGEWDYYDQEREIVVRGTNEHILDGSEGWFIRSGWETSTTHVFRANRPADYDYEQKFGTSDHSIMSPYFPEALPGEVNSNAEGTRDYAIRLSDFVYIKVPIVFATTPDNFKSWLSSNPTNIYYRLAEPYEIPVIPQPKIISVYALKYGQTNIFTSSIVQPTIKCDVRKLGTNA